MTDVLPPRSDDPWLPRGDDETIDHHQANYVYPPRPLPGPEPCEPALSWRPHPAIMARAPPFPFLRKAGPIPGSFWAVPGLLMCGPDPRWERRGATERLEDDFRIAEVVSDDVVVQARNLAPHLIEGPLVYVRALMVGLALARRRRGEVGQARVARRAFRAAQRRHAGAVGVRVAVLLLRVAVLRAPGGSRRHELPLTGVGVLCPRASLRRCGLALLAVSASGIYKRSPRAPAIQTARSSWCAREAQWSIPQ